MNEKINLKTHNYFPFHFRALGVLLVPVVIVPIFPLLSLGLGLLSFLLLTSHYRLEIDSELRTYKEYLWIFGFKQGEVIPYQTAESIFINVNSRNVDFGFAVRYSSSKKVYAAYLKLDREVKLYLGENASKTKLQKQITGLAEKLSVEIIESVS